MIYLNVHEDFEEVILPDVLEHTASAVLEELCDEVADLTIAIEDDEQLRALNLQFLEIDAPTDVLSFPAEETDPDSGNLYLGDIIISYPRALAQAESAGHPVQAELQLLVIHGVLHLLGYDHVTPELKEEMWALQAQFLKKLDIAIKKLPED